MFNDCRTEWRISDIENNLRAKADSYQVSTLVSDVDRLEHTVREISSLVDGLRFQLETCKSEVERLDYNKQDA